MTTLTDTIAANEATLAEHDYVPIDMQAEAWRCLCGATIDTGNHWDPVAHRAHLATVLAEQEAQRRKASLDAQGQWYGKPAGGGGSR